MAEIHIHQIFYSEETQRSNDSGFLGLNNLSNSRPDWREYWPIRNCLLSNVLNDDDYYGFLSPKFKEKTYLDAEAVHDFVRTHAGEVDVFLFSPFFDQSAFALNVFEQGIVQHDAIKAAFQGCVSMIAPGVDVSTLVMSSRNTVFCNYFVAKPSFWKMWLEKCELVFNEAEENKTVLGALLNTHTTYGELKVPIKIFVIERIASLLLSTHSQWLVKAYDPTQFQYGLSVVANYRRELLILDALKIAAEVQGDPEYLASFQKVRQALITTFQSAR